MVIRNIVGKNLVCFPGADAPRPPAFSWRDSANTDLPGKANVQLFASYSVASAAAANAADARQIAAVAVGDGVAAVWLQLLCCAARGGGGGGGGRGGGDGWC